MADDSLLNWLLEEDNPGVRLRTLTELCGVPRDDPGAVAARDRVVATFNTARDLSWMDGNGIRQIYDLTALAECGLTREDVAIDRMADRLLDQPFDANCGDYMLLRALVMLGYGKDSRIRRRLAQSVESRLPDGAWMCLHRLNKMNRTPKSCFKAALHALLLAGEMKKRGMTIPGSGDLVRYFLKRRLFYRTDAPERLVLHSQPGFRTTDAFFPVELMRVSLPLLLDALSALGVGKSDELREAWDILDAKRDAQGRTKLEGTINKSYLPKERVGRPGKWVTLYSTLARHSLHSRRSKTP